MVIIYVKLLFITSFLSTFRVIDTFASGIGSKMPSIPRWKGLETSA